MIPNDTKSDTSSRVKSSLFYHHQDILGAEYGEKIDRAWYDCKSDLIKIAPDFSADLDALDSRLTISFGLRPFGTLAPWLLENISSLSYGKSHIIARHCAALYIWCIEIDRIMDKNISVAPKIHMLHALLFNYATSGLSCLINNEQQKRTFFEYINKGITYQARSVSGYISNDIEEIKEIASGKNMFFCAIATVFKSLSQGEGRAVDYDIELISRHFAYVMQIMDDISDLQDDIEDDIDTVIIHKMKSTFGSQKINSFPSIVHAAVESGALHYALSEIVLSLEYILINLDGNDSIAYHFMKNLHSVSKEACNYAETRTLSDPLVERLRTLYMGS